MLQSDLEKFGWLGADAEARAKDIVLKQDEVAFSIDPNHMPALVSFDQWEAAEETIGADIDWGFDFNGFHFYEAVNRVHGEQLPPGPQSVGNCVAYGSSLSIADRYAVELCAFAESESWWAPFIPYSYGAGRVFVGGVHWPSDGSLGVWQIKADKEHGILPADMQGLPNNGPFDLQSSKSVNDQWKRSDSILNEWKPKAIQFAVGASTTIKSFDNLKIAICDKKQSVTIASNWGFRKAGDKDGFAVHNRSGSWAHQMHVRGCMEVNSNWYVHIGNQWGTTYHPPAGRGLPPGGFVIEAETFDRWAGSSGVECYSRGSIKGRVFQPDFNQW